MRCLAIQKSVCNIPRSHQIKRFDRQLIESCLKCDDNFWEFCVGFLKKDLKGILEKTDEKWKLRLWKLIINFNDSFFVFYFRECGSCQIVISLLCGRGWLISANNKKIYPKLISSALENEVYNIWNSSVHEISYKKYKEYIKYEIQYIKWWWW